MTPTKDNCIRAHADALPECTEQCRGCSFMQMMEFLPRPQYVLGGWRQAAAKTNPAKDDLYVVRDKDGQMAFASWTAQYGWEHVADNDCGEVVEWYPLPSRISPNERKQ